MVITRTNVHPFGILKTPLDRVVNDLFNYNCDPERSVLQKHVLQMWLYLRPSDMICSAFHLRLQDQHERIPPRACRTLKSKKQKNYVQDMGPTKENKDSVHDVGPNNVKKQVCAGYGLLTRQKQTLFRILYRVLLVGLLLIGPY